MRTRVNGLTSHTRSVAWTYAEISGNADYGGFCGTPRIADATDVWRRTRRPTSPTSLTTSGMAGCVPKLTVVPGPPVGLWVHQEDGGWIRFDLLGRLQQYVEPCSQVDLLAWALSHSKITFTLPPPE